MEQVEATGRSPPSPQPLFRQGERGLWRPTDRLGGVESMYQDSLLPEGLCYRPCATSNRIYPE